MPYCCGYRRVSTSDQKDSDLGLTAQQEAIESHFQLCLKPKGFEWGGLYTDPAVSGRKDFVNRPAGSELNLRLHHGDVVLFHKIDRGFRSISDMLSALEAFEQREISAYFIQENLSTNDGPMGKLLLHKMRVPAAMLNMALLHGNPRSRPARRRVVAARYLNGSGA